MTLLSYNNDPKIKADLIERMDRHIELDNLLQGATGDGGKGCTVWCALNNGHIKAGYNHEAFESILGLPEWLARLQDRIFEGLIVEDAKWFSSEWPKAIPVGKDLDPVKWKFSAFLMGENIERVLLLDIEESLKEQVVSAIRGVLTLNVSAIETGVWDESAARSAARSAAWSAESAAWSAESAARSAAESARSAAESARSAAGSAESAAWSAESAARSAESAARSAAESARSAAYKKHADKLLELLRNA